MDLSAVRTRRKKSLFRPWNSYLAKKGVVDAAAAARACDAARRRAANGSAPHAAPVVRLTAGLLDTYEGINEAYYDKRTTAHPPQRAEGLPEGTAQGEGELELQNQDRPRPLPVDPVDELGTAGSLSVSQAPVSAGSLGSVGRAPVSGASVLVARAGLLVLLSVVAVWEQSVLVC